MPKNESSDFRVFPFVDPYDCPGRNPDLHVLDIPQGFGLSF